jgi:hypothetical protein
LPKLDGFHCVLFWNGFLASAYASVTGFMVHGGTWNGFLVVVLAIRPYDHVKLFHATFDV